MLNVLDKYESLLSFVRKSKDFDKKFYEDLIEFLYQREQQLEEDEAEESLIDWWISCNSDD